MSPSTKSALQAELQRLDIVISNRQTVANIAQESVIQYEAELAQLRSTRLEIRLDLQA